MCVVDDILFFPGTSLMFILKEIHKAAVEEMGREADEVRADLSRLYLRLEAGDLTGDEFDAQEAALLDRLDELEGLAGDPDDDEADEDNESDDTDDADPEIEVES